MVMDAVLRKNFSYLFALQSINYLVPLALLPYLTRVLGSENFGKIAFAQAFVTYFILLTDFGFNLSATQEVVKVKDNKLELSKVFWSTTFSKLILGGVSLILFTIMLLTVPKFRELATLFVLAFTGVISTILFPVWFFQGVEKMAYITWFNSAPKILVLLFTFLMVREQTDFQLALLIQVTATLISSLICAIFIYKLRLIQYYRPKLTDLRQTVKESWEIFASGVATNIYTTTNTVVLGLFSTHSTVGIFAASEKIIRSIIPLFASVSQVTFPRINSYYQISKEQALHFGRKILLYSFFPTLAIGISLLVFAPQIVGLLFGLPQYQETITVLRISSFIPLFSICNGILAVNLLVTFGLKKKLLWILPVGGLFSLATVFPAVILFQVNGVAFVALATEIIISGLLLLTFKHYKIELNLWRKFQK
jgi:O-antigen/teichoic acid export membrane protein